MDVESQGGSDSGHIYLHLAHVEGILKPLKVSDTEVWTPYISRGSLDRYLSANKATVDNTQRLRWFRDAAEIIFRVHRQRVLLADISARNFLVNADLSLQLFGFSKSVIILVEQALDEFISEDFLSIKSDIARFGSMMYEIVTGHRYEFYVTPEIEADLQDSEPKIYRQWPTSEKLPATTDVFLGDIIRKRWLRDGFGSIDDVCVALHCAHAPGKEEEPDATLDWWYLLGIATPMIILTVIAVRHFPWQKAADALSFNRASG
ncbi:hypothetical protein ASPCADRAFT_9595 [Aspergillus carbonarius ITEM 5010]|uniref:Serine-threonine/tyrosine-protein kinase catalytic domain-containing protein n=1 Tax=Aspergillus carbonarius (strain ITEM 5010) TaxID=602072 RepID=A0A1R3RB06_ASPC5|nr:hypothetical protein ASPCADRAFT_9595 [Aspergillus carbonarius ITEM 5010]